jgi:hypothetical protein
VITYVGADGYDLRLPQGPVNTAVTASNVVFQHEMRIILFLIFVRSVFFPSMFVEVETRYR